MEATLHRSFGLVATIVKVKKGEEITGEPIVKNVYEVGLNFSYVNMHTKGVDVLVNTVTGETITRSPGDNTIDNPVPIGSWRITLPEDAEIVCYSPFINTDKLPLKDYLEPVVIKAGNSKLMTKGTQFFLAAGGVSINEHLISGPKQILVKNDDVLVFATNDAYGFIVR